MSENNISNEVPKIEENPWKQKSIDEAMGRGEISKGLREALDWRSEKILKDRQLCRADLMLAGVGLILASAVGKVVFGPKLGLVAVTGIEAELAMVGEAIGREKHILDAPIMNVDGKPIVFSDKVSKNIAATLKALGGFF